MTLSVLMLTVYESSLGQPRTTANMTVEGATITHVTKAVEPECIISPFDPIMRKVGAEEGLDWRFMSAIAYSESRFIENLKSSRGARGIMQIRPIVARHFNVPVEAIGDTETNIRLAGMLLSELDSMLRIPHTTPEEDRLSIILASYNAGIGHVLDARRMARAAGANPNSWEIVNHYLKLKADPAYYKQEFVQNGRFSGSSQTESYVREVMKMYNRYCAVASLS